MCNSAFASSRFAPALDVGSKQRYLVLVVVRVLGRTCRTAPRSAVPRVLQNLLDVYAWNLETLSFVMKLAAVRRNSCGVKCSMSSRTRQM